MRGQIIKISTNDEYLIIDERKIDLKEYFLANKLNEKRELTNTFTFFVKSVLKDNYLYFVNDKDELDKISKEFAKQEK